MMECKLTPGEWEKDRLERISRLEHSEIQKDLQSVMPGRKNSELIPVEEIIKIYNAWVGFMEFWSKSSRLRLLIPPSFYPYPPDQLYEVLNIMEQYYNAIDVDLAKSIQETRLSLNFKSDEESLSDLRESLNFWFGPKMDNVRKDMIIGLHEERDNWLKLRKENKLK